jgi:P27 family predicted phage terminase small subunit
MGRRGPQKTPISLKLLKGNPGKEGLGKMAAKMPPTPGDSKQPPADLEGVALEKWLASVPMLSTMRVWSEDAATTWARYCPTYALWLETQTYIEKNGQVYETVSGLYKARPETILCRGYSADLLRIEQSFGLVPSAKSSVTIQEQTVDPMEAFLREA